MRAEKTHWLSNGWEFVTVVGKPRGTVDDRSIRYSNPQTGRLTVIAPSSRLPGNPGVDETRTFKADGYEFLEVKIMTSPADGYGIVFRKPLQRIVLDLEQRVDQRVVLEGIVGETKVPDVQGVDVWALDNYRGQRVRVSGILRKEVVTEADVDPSVANRGAGTFYSLDDMAYEVLK